MRFSIVLPVRNGGAYVKECVNSILCQTYPYFNLVVLDNCSTDGTVEWLTSLNDQRIVIHTSKESLSIEQNWARIKTVPRNEFMTCIGHDDVLLPNYLEEMNGLVRTHPGASLFQTHFNFIDASGAFIRECLPVSLVEDAPGFLEKLLTMGIDVNGTGFMTRSKDYDAVGGIPAFPNLIFADFALWLDITSLGYKVTSPKNCFSYRLHQSMTATTSPERFYAAFKVFVSYLAHLKNKDSLGTVVTTKAKNIISFYCRSFSHKLLRAPIQKRNGITVAAWINKCREYTITLTGDESFDPYKIPGVKSAAIIDSNSVTRLGFRLFKKIYSRPVWTDQ